MYSADGTSLWVKINAVNEVLCFSSAYSLSLFLTNLSCIIHYLLILRPRNMGSFILKAGGGGKGGAGPKTLQVP